MYQNVLTRIVRSHGISFIPAAAKGSVRPFDNLTDWLLQKNTYLPPGTT